MLHTASETASQCSPYSFHARFSSTYTMCLGMKVCAVTWTVSFLACSYIGEEISMSARLWTSGYDIFSPTINVLNHYYVRRHYPKFWESVNRCAISARSCLILLY